MFQNNFQTSNFKSSAIRNIVLFGDKLPLPTYIVSAIMMIGCFSLAAYFNIELYFLLGVIGIALLWIMLHYPKVWIYIVVVGGVVFFDVDEEGISVVDIFAAVFFNIFLIIWFFTKLLVKSEKQIVTNKSRSTFNIIGLTEKLFLLFYFLLLFNSVIAVANDIDFTDWIREYMLFLLLLYYFPIRDYFDDKFSIIVLLVIFSSVVIVFDIRQFLMFRKLLSNITTAWEIGLTSWKINQGFYSAVILMGITMFLYTKSKIGKLFSYFVVLLTTFTLISTFARAYWLSVSSLIFLLSVLYVRPRQFLQLLLVVILTAGVLLISLDTFFPKQSQFVQKFVTNKLSSSTKGRSDPSVESRLREFEVVNREIYESPLFGQGFRKMFSFYDNTKKHNQVTSFIHNGYLNLAHKTGIPMTILFYSVVILFNIRGYIVAWRLKRYCYRNSLDITDQHYFFTALSIGSSLTITMFLITNIVTSSFIFRDGLIITAFIFAFISITERKYNRIKDADSST